MRRYHYETVCEPRFHAVSAVAPRVRWALLSAAVTILSVAGTASPAAASGTASASPSAETALSSIKLRERVLEATVICSANGRIDVTPVGARRRSVTARYRCQKGRATVTLRLAKRLVSSGQIGRDLRIRLAARAGTTPVTVTVRLARPSRRVAARAAAWSTWSKYDGNSSCYSDRRVWITARSQSRFGLPVGQFFWWRSMVYLYTPRTNTFEWKASSTWFSRVAGAPTPGQDSQWTVAAGTWVEPAIQIYGYDWNFVWNYDNPSSTWCFFA